MVRDMTLRYAALRFVTFCSGLFCSMILFLVQFNSVHCGTVLAIEKTTPHSLLILQIPDERVSANRSLVHVNQKIPNYAANISILWTEEVRLQRVLSVRLLRAEPKTQEPPRKRMFVGMSVQVRCCADRAVGH